MNLQPVIFIIRKSAPYVASSLLGALVHRIKFPRRKSVEVSVQGSADFDTTEGRVSVRMGDDLRDPAYSPPAEIPGDDLNEFNHGWPVVSDHA